ncbi:MAG: hypothetical protein AAGJ82_13985, partial [Bacteroidota bacterium]
EYQWLTYASYQNYASYALSTALNYSYQRRKAWEQHLLAFPLTVRHDLPQFKRSWRPFLLVGARAEFLHRLQRLQFNQTTDLVGSVTQDFIQYDFQFKTLDFPYRRWNLSAILGLGMQYERTQLSLQYIGNFRSPDDVQYLNMETYYATTVEFIRPYVERGERFRIPGSWRLQFGYRLF